MINTHSKGLPGRTGSLRRRGGRLSLGLSLAVLSVLLILAMTLPALAETVYPKPTNYIADDAAILSESTVREIKEKNETLISEVAEVCDISHLFESHPYDLSGGEQQRTALAKVLLTQPDVLLLDEPTKGMDNFFKLQFAQILAELKDKGVTIIMVSHDVEFCARYADSVSMFFDGGIITSNTPHRFFSKNSFYTTAANRMSRHLFTKAITNEDVIELCKKNL